MNEPTVTHGADGDRGDDRRDDIRRKHDSDNATGSCLCGAVRYEVAQPLRNVVVCHCAMCRKTHGHFAAYSAAPKTALKLVESRGLRWFRSSPEARRGFCCECGGSLFWEADAKDYVSIAAGTLDGPTGLESVVQIHVDDAADYYDLPNIPIRDE